LEGVRHIGAGAETAARARHDDRTDFAVLVGALDRIDEFDTHARRPRVQPIRAMQGEECDCVAALHADLFVVQGSLLTQRFSRTVPVMGTKRTGTTSCTS
jgi:uncharacterized protein YlaI